MSPITKITNPASEHQHVSSSIKCPYCGNTKCWKHGHYVRKGFYSPKPGNDWTLQTVQRFLCRDVACKHTFSVLPENVLPYCRFLWKDFFDIAFLTGQGKTTYHIAKYQWVLPLRTILRVRGIITKVHQWLEQLCREALHTTVSEFATLATTALQTYSWFDFTRRWFHHIYPCRVSKCLNPHNMDIKNP
jgi:hypothetical protein